MVEGAREMERFRIATLQVEQLLAKRARLEAERDGVSALSVSSGGFSASSMPDDDIAASSIPFRLSEANEGIGAETSVATESTILRAEQARRRLQEKEIGLRVAAARNEVEVLKHKLDQFTIQKDLRTERLVAMQQLKDRGVETSNNVLVLRTDLADIEARRQDSLVAVAGAEARLAVVEEEGSKLTLDYMADLAKEIEATNKEIGEAQEAVISAKAMATILLRSNDQSLERSAYDIVRQSKDGAKKLAATETSPLMPGDVLKVTRGESAAIDARSAATSP